MTRLMAGRRTNPYSVPRKRFLASPKLQSRSGAHPASYSAGTEGFVLLVVAVEHVRSGELRSYAGGSAATDRVSQAEQIKSEVPDKQTHRGTHTGAWALG
jgi:hypothetical protein